MHEPNSTGAASIERACSILAVAVSAKRRTAARLMTGERRCFGLGLSRTVVDVPFPPPAPGWSLRSLACGVALQCAPSKDLLANYKLRELTGRQRDALTIVEGEVAIAWLSSRWAGLLPEIRRLAPPTLLGELGPLHGDWSASDMLDRAQQLALSKLDLRPPALFGRLPAQPADGSGLRSTLQRVLGQMPWSHRRPLSSTLHTIPVAGQGGAQNPNLPPPSRPEDEDPEIRPDQRAGIPYPEWNMWLGRHLPGHVAVLERKHTVRGHGAEHASAELRRWFQQRTHRAFKGRLEDGSDLDVDAFVAHSVNARTHHATEARVFRDLVPVARDVVTAVLLDGSSSIGAQKGRTFAVELACADALSGAMMIAGERHGLFVFSGNTRHRVEVACLKDFDDRHFVVPGKLGLVTGGYTRLGAPIRHLTSRLLRQPGGRRLLLVVGDGFISDEGYEGKYAWADVTHAVEEARTAGVLVYYIGIGPARVDPLPETFGPRQSVRIARVDSLPRVLSSVHRELVSV